MTERPRVPAAYEGRLANALTDLSSMPFLGRARSPILRPPGVLVRAAVGWDREGCHRYARHRPRMLDCDISRNSPNLAELQSLRCKDSVRLQRKVPRQCAREAHPRLADLSVCPVRPDLELPDPGAHPADGDRSVPPPGAVGELRPAGRAPRVRRGPPPAVLGPDRGTRQRGGGSASSGPVRRRAANARRVDRRAAALPDTPGSPAGERVGTLPRRR